ncbi:DUF4105 domain-containing protein [Treponema zioleckii]|uniref:Lnb N-terminal periplasmic domain-containing protein n=1 Tax=Treponema zioleckii TaxID=331680 RepID=UPI00168BF99D|nr:DUF4105 domain-containing protein [Treponema zioleckii]
MKNLIGKNRRRSFCLFFLLQTILIPLASQELASEPDLSSYSARTEELVKKADELKLYDDDLWRILLLYEKSLGGTKSIITSKEFFLSENGQKNPRDEMLTDIRAFRQSKNVADFPARFKFLKEKLSDSDSDFPEIFDRDYAEIKKTVNPTSVYLVYPSGFMQNPASMFGHTLIVFHDENKSRLLGQSVTFSARNTENPGIIFALKGLFGLYSGDFVIEPYSKQILKYSDMDKRDIWEYKLRLTDDQIDMLLRHSIELSRAHSKYYYISRNCTAGLMLLLESSFPNENLSKELGEMAEPVEAIKILHKKNLIDGEPIFRPSLHTEILLEKSELNSQLAKAVKSYCKGKITLETLLEKAESDEEKAKCLKLSVDYLKHRLSAGKLSQSDYQKRIMPVFKAMTKFKFSAQNFTSNDFPHESHDSHKIAFSFGVDDGEIFEKLSFRLVNHDLIDEDKGLNKNTQLDFFTGAFSFYQGRGGLNGFSDINEAEEIGQKIQIDKILFCDILSLPVSDSYFFNKALEIVCGMERTQFSAEQDFLAFRFKGFSGASFKIWNANQFYALAGVDFYAHPDFDTRTDPLFGLECGLLTTSGRWKQSLFALAEQGIFKNDGTHGKEGLIGFEEIKNRNRLRLFLTVEERLTLTRNTALSAKYTFGGDYKTYKHKGELTAHFNF